MSCLWRWHNRLVYYRFEQRAFSFRGNCSKEPVFFLFGCKGVPVLVCQWNLLGIPTWGGVELFMSHVVLLGGFPLHAPCLWNTRTCTTCICNPSSECIVNCVMFHISQTMACGVSCAACLPSLPCAAHRMRCLPLAPAAQALLVRFLAVLLIHVGGSAILLVV